MGRFEFIELDVKELNTKKLLRVYLPNDYSEDKKYPVLYMHDGQNIYEEDSSAFNISWNVHKVIEDLVSKDVISPLIVVGIDCNESVEGTRMDEYSPWKSTFKIDSFEGNIEDEDFKKMANLGGLGDIYGDFLVNKVKPLIDERYSTLTDRENTLLAGSSMGGIITLYLGLKYSNIFSKLGCFSSAFFFAIEPLIEFLKENKIQDKMKLYFDVGTRESGEKTNSFINNTYIDTNNTIVDLIKEKNDPNLQDILYVVEEGAYHNEIAWNKRFPKFLEWILN